MCQMVGPGGSCRFRVTIGGTLLIHPFSLSETSMCYSAEATMVPLRTMGLPFKVTPTLAYKVVLLVDQLLIVLRHCNIQL